MIGESSNLMLLDLHECVRVAREHPDLIVGVKVRVGRGAGGSSGIAPLDMAIECAEELGLPVMAHIDHPPPTRREVLDRLRPGDILTHCYRNFPNSLLAPNGRARDEAVRARERGVHFDIGHGFGSFGFKACRGLLDAGFAPDAISSDIHCLNIDGPAYDLLVTMSKFLVMGMELNAIVAAVTSGPANAIRRPSLGTLAVGTEGDATVLDIEEGRFEFRDTQNEALAADRRFRLRTMVVGGRLFD
jgi:dihydroorotase